MSEKHTRAFSIIELMVVVTTIGLLALIGTPSAKQAANQAKATALANDLRLFVHAIELYTTATGNYPSAMTTAQIPEAVSDYLPSAWRSDAYQWHYQNNENLIFLAINDLHFTPEQVMRLDRIIDDGNIATGAVRILPPGSSIAYLIKFPQ